MSRNRYVIIGAVFVVSAFIGGTGYYFRTNDTQSKEVTNEQQEKNWAFEEQSILQAEKLISENKLDEAEALLSPIASEYPDYKRVTDLLGTIAGKRIEIANQTPPAPTVSKPPTSRPLQPAPTQPFSTSIQIKGDDTCRSTTLEALKLLSQKAPTHYATVTKYIGVIECANRGSGMFAYENPPRYLVGDATRNAGVIWYAGTIAHDAGHSQQYNSYLQQHPGSSVPNDVWTGEASERACLDAQYDALVQIGATQAQLDHIKNVINTQYYNVSYEDRWW